ncbi:MAG: ABC transporter substrate-binding protein [Ktedonobacteraceae bacterium]|nr:ABC transporter substrate-binding protein [Ktedonobacteraceae bacterium]
MKTSSVYWLRIIALVVLFALAGCGAQPSSNSSGQLTVRLAYYPNLTHAVALVGVQRGTFQNALGPNVKLETKIFNAGPAEIEALFANEIDIGYIGPSPAINGYVKSHGEALRIIAGAASGGALFIVRPAANINSAQDLSGKKIATPQLGGTQDVALRYYLQQHDLKTADKGGTVQIIPTDNPNILTLFKQGKIDGAWVPEPWATRLIVEGNGRVFVDERTLWPNGKFVTTDVIVRKAFLDQHPDVVNKFLQAHVDTVQYILSNPASAKTIMNSEIERITGKALPSNEINLAYSNLDITYDPLTATLQEGADRAYALGFLGSSNPNLKGIYYLGPINQVLTAKKLTAVVGP